MSTNDQSIDIRNDEPTDIEHANIEYPQQTSAWGRTLIDVLNTHLNTVHLQMQSINDNINEKFRSFKDDIEELKSKTDSALALAQQNQVEIEQQKQQNKIKFDEMRS